MRVLLVHSGKEAATEIESRKLPDFEYGCSVRGKIANRLLRTKLKNKFCSLGGRNSECVVVNMEEVEDGEMWWIV